MIKIRSAQNKDASGICQVSVSTWKDTYKNLIDIAYLNSLSVSDISIKKWENRIDEVKNKKYYLWVAVSSDQIVGFLWGGEAREPKIDDLNFEIYAIYVLPEFQHQGIGKKLFSCFKRKVGKSFFLWMLKHNKSEAFYLSLKGKKTDHLKIQIFANKKYQEIAYIWKIKNK